MRLSHYPLSSACDSVLVESTSRGSGSLMPMLSFEHGPFPERPTFSTVTPEPLNYMTTIDAI